MAEPKCLVYRKMSALLYMTSDHRIVKLLFWISYVPRTVSRIILHSRKQDLTTACRDTLKHDSHGDIFCTFLFEPWCWYAHFSATGCFRACISRYRLWSRQISHRHESMPCNTNTRLIRWRLISSTRRKCCILTGSGLDLLQRCDVRIPALRSTTFPLVNRKPVNVCSPAATADRIVVTTSVRLRWYLPAVVNNVERSRTFHYCRFGYDDADVFGVSSIAKTARFLPALLPLHSRCMSSALLEYTRSDQKSLYPCFVVIVNSNFSERSS